MGNKDKAIMKEIEDHSDRRDSLDDWIDAAVPADLGASFARTREEQKPHPFQFQAGDTIGGFRLVALIGQGGMGQVWEAQQLALSGRSVAVKFLRDGMGNGKQLAYFEREARAASRLSHPGIVTVHGSGRSDGVAWIAMELVPGAWTLRNLIDEISRESDLPARFDEQVARLALELARAIESAHESGVIHRDLKPQNILITPQNRPKLTDFGLARIIDESALSVTGDMAGTYYYMSPEQVAGRRMGIDHRTDVFSLGVILYELLSLSRPFKGDTSHQVAHQVLTKEPTDLRSIRSRIPSDLVVIVGKALEKDPDRRYATMKAMGDDLERFLAKEAIHAVPPSVAHRVNRWCRRHPVWSLTGTVSLIALVLILSLSFRVLTQGGVLAEQQEQLGFMYRGMDQISLEEEYEALLKLERDLRLPYPESIQGLSDWVARAESLRTQLPDLIASRDELRAQALPYTEAERAADRVAFESSAQFDRLEKELRSRRAALDVRERGTAVELIELDWSEYPASATGLIAMARELSGPFRESFGEELVGVQLARRAVEVSKRNKWLALDALAWACLAVGDDEGALQASFESAQAAPAREEDKVQKNSETLEAAVAHASSELGIAEARQWVVDLDGRRAELSRQEGARRTWSFGPSPEDGINQAWWHGKLTELVEGVEALVDPTTGHLAETVDEKGFKWSVRKRLSFALDLQKEFATGGAFAERWEQALPRIRAAYPQLSIGPQMGLVPLGADRDSGLWEFWHIQSGEEPVRDSGGNLVIEEGTGLVLVLIPPGEFWMGSQGNSTAAQNYDPESKGEEGPVHLVQISSFFLSKYEMTQGQWSRVTSSNPSRWGVESAFAGYRHDLTHPVERISWEDCMEVLPDMGLTLPSEAQWEYAARAGTDFVWWTGNQRDSLPTAHAVNLADQSADRMGFNWVEIWHWPDLDDGYVAHAPVDEFAPNPFGLHNVHGNVWEWVQDVFENDAYVRSSEQDPVNLGAETDLRIRRGGAYNNSHARARSARRGSRRQHLATMSDGVRPALALLDSE